MKAQLVQTTSRQEGGQSLEGAAAASVKLLALCVAFQGETRQERWRLAAATALAGAASAVLVPLAAAQRLARASRARRAPGLTPGA